MITLDLIEIQQATKGTIHNAGHTLFTAHISIDSRRVEAGDLFIPLVGERFDGHDFIPEAINRGAKGVLLQKGRYTLEDIPSDVSVILVDNTLTALGDLARLKRHSFNGPVVAITGSNGKTTTKDMCAAVLQESFMVLANQGNQNNEVGLPLTLFNLTSDHEVVVLEMGMRGLGQIQELCSIAEPTIGVITNVGNTHLELLGSIANIAQAKGELVEALPMYGWAILNADDPWVSAMKNKTKANILTYGLSQKADIRGNNIRSRGYEGLSFDLVWNEHTYPMTIPMLARHNVYNSLAAVAVGLVLGLDPEVIAKRLENPVLTGMRMQVEKLDNGITLINDAYNSSPAAVLSALEVLLNLPAKRRIAVLGDMRELGEASVYEHQRVGSECPKNNVDVLICVGDMALGIAEGAISGGMDQDAVFTFSDYKSAGPFLADFLTSEDLVLIKASRAVGLERVIEFIKD